MKLIIVDLDGTLFDTKDVNYHAYKDAITPYGYDIDYKYYCQFCNGRHYLEFLPQITTNNKEILTAMHKAKKNAYKNHLNKAILNNRLVDIIRLMKLEYKTAVVTTASRENCSDILSQFNLVGLFDLILTHDDIAKSKPDPEGFLKAMQYFGSAPSETIIFEDSDVGLEAAERSGAFYYRTYRFS
ncbi:HAD family phosphatase [Blautia schinkii]|nr:HAD family phosphatase [Blautia schinkii]